MMMTSSLITDYLSWEFNPLLKSHVETLLLHASRRETSDSAKRAKRELEELFEGPRVEFGTAGLRAPFGPGFARMNDLVVMQTAQGLFRALGMRFSGEDLRRRGILVGYDHRAAPEFHLSSRNFALVTAAVFVSKGARVVLYEGFTPTPLVPFGVKLHGCLAGIMVTASHNPKLDDGYKLYWENACQIVSPIDDLIAKCILQELVPWKDAVDLFLRGGETEIRRRCGANGGSLLTQRTLDAYVKACKERLPRMRWTEVVEPPEKSRESTKKIAYTAMHGVGLPLFTRCYVECLEGEPVPSLEIVREQAEPDPAFPTVPFPNPEEKGALDLATASADRCVGCDVVFANDPDADRFAVCEKVETTTEASSPRGKAKWRQFTGDEIAALFAWWVVECDEREKKNTNDTRKRAMVVSAVSSGFVQRMGEARGVEVEETLTGFKWIGNRVNEKREKEGKKVLFSYEEAIGFCVGDVVLDKDGITAGITMSRIITWLRLRENGKSLSQKLEELRALYGRVATHNGYLRVRDPRDSSAIFERLRNEGRYFTFLGGGRYRVTRIRDLDKKKPFDSATLDALPTLPRTSLMITFFAVPREKKGSGRDQFRVTLRASGTEPKLKYYCEWMGEGEGEATLETFVREAVLGDLLRERVVAKI